MDNTQEHTIFMNEAHNLYEEWKDEIKQYLDNPDSYQWQMKSKAGGWFDTHIYYALEELDKPLQIRREIRLVKKSNRKSIGQLFDEYEGEDYHIFFHPYFLIDEADKLDKTLDNDYARMIMYSLTRELKRHQYLLNEIRALLEEDAEKRENEDCFVRGKR